MNVSNAVHPLAMVRNMPIVLLEMMVLHIYFQLNIVLYQEFFWQIRLVQCFYDLSVCEL